MAKRSPSDFWMAFVCVFALVAELFGGNLWVIGIAEAVLIMFYLFPSLVLPPPIPPTPPTIPPTPPKAETTTRKLMSRDRALLVGINYIDDHPENRLGGCAADARDMTKFLVSKGVQCVVLSDDIPEGGWPIAPSGKPTKQCIHAELTSMAEWTHTNPGARCWFYFSGPGSQVDDLNDDEDDGRDEYLYLPNGEKFIDDELGEFIPGRKMSHDSQLLAIVDACKAGTVFDLSHINNDFAWSSPDNTPKVVCISGSTDDTFAFESPVWMPWRQQHERGGHMTAALLRILKSAYGSSLTIRSMRDDLRVSMPAVREQKIEIRSTTPIGPTSVLPCL
jgi:hypothetical protein